MRLVRSIAAGLLAATAWAAPLTITTVPPLFNGTVGIPYTQKFTATGGTPPYTWSVASGDLGGMALDPATGTIQGTPQTATTYSFVIQVADSSGLKASQSFSITIQPPALVIALSTLPPNGAVGTPYSYKFSAAASGGTPPYTWSLSGLIPGLDFDPAAMTLSGVPSSPGTFALTLRAADSAGLTAARALSVVVTPQSLAILTSRQLPAATLGTPFAQSLVAAGGAIPYTWTAAGLPAGLAIDSRTGAISGTPSAAGAFGPIVVTVTDSAFSRFSDNFSLSVNAPPLPAISISGLPAAPDPAQQYPLQIALDSPYAAPITGQALVTFSPDSGPADSTIAFASGGTSASFTLPAGALAAGGDASLALQTGTAAGVLTVTLRLQAGGIDITPSPAPAFSATIGRAAPVITATQVTRTANSITIFVTGYSTAREVTQATFTFSAASGQTLQSTAGTMNLDVGGVFGPFFASSSMGGQFLFTQPFTVQGDPAAVIPVSVTLTNRAGSQTAAIKP